MNIFNKCKSVEELKDAYYMEKMACETFEWLGKIDRDYEQKYYELLDEVREEK